MDELGGNSTALLNKLNVPPAAVDSDDALLPSATVTRLIEAAAADVGRPDLGLLLADRQGIETLGPLAGALQAATSVADVFDVATRFLFVHSPDLTLALEDDPFGDHGLVAVTLRHAFSDAAYSPRVMELGIGLTHRICQALFGEAYLLRSVHFPHQPVSPCATYREFFGSDVRFGQAEAMLRVPLRLLDQALDPGDADTHAEAVRYLESHFTAPSRGVADRVVAALRMHVVTLQRLAFLGRRAD